MHRTCLLEPRSKHFVDGPFRDGQARQPAELARADDEGCGGREARQYGMRQQVHEEPGAHQPKGQLNEAGQQGQGDRERQVAIGVSAGEVSDAVSYLADALQSAKNGGVFLDEQPIGKLRSDWQPGPGYEAVKSLTYAP